MFGLQIQFFCGQQGLSIAITPFEWGFRWIGGGGNYNSTDGAGAMQCFGFKIGPIGVYASKHLWPS